MNNIQAFPRDNAWFAPGKTPKTPRPKTQAPRRSIAGTPADHQEWQEYGILPYSCSKWIHRMAEIALTGPAGLRGPRAPGHAGIYLTGSLRSPLPGRGGPGAPRVYGQTRAQGHARRRSAPARRRDEWVPAHSSHGTLIKIDRRRSSAEGTCPGVIARSRSSCWRWLPARSAIAGSLPRSFRAPGSHRQPRLCAEAAHHPAGPAARGPPPR